MILLAAACSGGLDSETGVATDSAETSVEMSVRGGLDAPQTPMADEPMDEVSFDGDSDDMASEPGVTTSGAAGSDVAAQLPDLGRDIIFTATLELASTDVSTATRDAIRSIEGRGGFLFSQETRGGAGGSSVLTFKVLPEQFQAALNDLGAIGEVRSQSISADDVSAIVVDLESRINTSEASVLRLRALLDDATELETIATVENQLLERETSLEQLRGQLRTVRNQVDLATITVFVTELTTRPGIAINALSYGAHDEGFGCFDNQGTRSGEVGDPITICYLVTNTGDTPLVDITLDDPALDATIDSLVVVDGSAVQLAPGEILVLAHEIELTKPVRVRTSVSATALDADRAELDEKVGATAASIRFDVTDFDAGFPSFGTVLTRSWDALKTAAIVVALVLVAIAPFVAVGLLVGVPLLAGLRRRRGAQPDAATNTRATTPPPPPTVADATIGTTPPSGSNAPDSDESGETDPTAADSATTTRKS